jgi:aminoglycoside phosphotransferase (APT) family kinase protein
MWKALSSAGTQPLERKSVLLHGDYHAGNTLWAHGRLSGIVDWETVERGPRGRDLGYARMDCTITGGRTMAKGLSEGYGLEVDDLWFWELLAAVEAATFYRDWQPAWRHYDLVDLDLRTVRRRLDGFIHRTLKAV